MKKSNLCSSVLSEEVLVDLVEVKMKMVHVEQDVHVKKIKKVEIFLNFFYFFTIVYVFEYTRLSFAS
jgi:hypothetical protein